MSQQISPEQFEQLTQKRTEQGKSTLDDDVKAALERGQNNMNNEVLREVTTKSVEAMNEENWQDVRNWMDKNLPQVPLARVKNIIRAGGRTAWGMFQNNAVCL